MNFYLPKNPAERLASQNPGVERKVDMLIFISRRSRLSPLRVLGCAILLSTLAMLGQSTVGTGAIRGSVTDPADAAVVGAKVTITGKATGGLVQVVTSSTGLYSSGPLLPGNYTVRVEAKGFKTAQFAVTTRVAELSGADVKLQAGKETEVVEMPGVQPEVNTTQATLQSVFPADLIDALPLNTRSYLDLAQFAPGAQFVDAGDLGPNKVGITTLSVDGRSGRAVRYQVDGTSISDETVGTPTQDLSGTAIQEVNVASSLLDLSTGMTSSGAVNVVTRTGSNDLHGEAFGILRPNAVSAKLPGSATQSLQREQYGARVGGAFIKDKLSYFVDAERTQQNLTAAVPFAAPFNALGDTLSQPFRDLVADGRLDWQRRDHAHAFYRFSYDDFTQVGSFGAGTSLQAMRNATHTPSHTVGYDFSRGNYVHSIRAEYLRMSSGLGDATASLPAGVDNPIPGIGISIGAPVAGSCAEGGGAYCAGPSPFAENALFQSNYQLRYDGSRVWGDHILRFGANFDRLQAGGFAPRNLNPQVGTTGICLTESLTSAACATSADPTAYPADFAYLSNGSGFATSKSAFGYPGGGLADNRIEAYGGDAWRYTHNFTLIYGLRWFYEDGRLDHSFGGLSILNDWQPGLGNPVRNPKFDFAPQLGFAWDIGGTGKTVLRGGTGLYYDTTLWANTMLDSRARTARGLLSYTPQVCGFGDAMPFFWPTSLAGDAVGTPVAGGSAVVSNPATNQVKPTFCGSPISTAAPSILALSSAFQSATAANASPQVNPNYIVNTLNASNANGVDLFAPNFLTPRSIQINFGFQTELQPGMVFSADYVRSIGDHNLLIVDQNHSGAARSYNLANATAARDAAQTAVGCPTGRGEAQCVVAALGSVAAAQAAYSAAGLDSNSATTGGGPCSFCAFPGVTPLGQNNAGANIGNGALGTLDMMSTIGRSIYSGGQAKLVQTFTRPANGIKSAQLLISYTFSKFTSQSPDQDLAMVATNNDRPLEFTGDNGMDRKHQVSLGGSFEFPKRVHLSLLGRFFSPLAQTLLLPQLTNGGQIYATDWMGSGLGSGAAPAPIPGTEVGQFMRKTKIATCAPCLNYSVIPTNTNPNNFQNTISSYNTHYAGTLTPAGHCLVADGSCPGNGPVAVMTSADMTALGWVMPTIPSVNVHAMNVPWLEIFDLRASWPVTFRDRITIEPSAAVFNVFNFGNAGQAGNMFGNSLYPGPNPTFQQNGFLAPNVIGGITDAGLNPFRAGLQSGNFAAGAPRQVEFGLKITF
jgi:Carboxypeptidase regulatory-like domain